MADHSAAVEEIVAHLADYGFEEKRGPRCLGRVFVADLRVGDKVRCSPPGIGDCLVAITKIRDAPPSSFREIFFEGTTEIIGDFYKNSASLEVWR